MNYPTDRKSFYAHRLTRLLFKSCAAQSLGQDAVLLVIHIAHTEDAARYQCAVRFWNSQLNEVLGFRSPKSLNNARQKAVACGWLHYERDNDRTVGYYWTIIPKSVLLFNDEPIEPSGTVPSTERENTNRSKYGTGSGTGSGTGNDLPSIPVPNPVPKEKRPRFEIPSLKDIKAYCIEQRNKVNPEQFHDHYTANGWIQGKGKPIRDWKAAVRTWERNGLKNATQRSNDHSEYLDLDELERQKA